MYGRPQAYPRQYGNAYPAQPQSQYPPQQQYPPQGGYPRQPQPSAYPPLQQYGGPQQQYRGPQQQYGGPQQQYGGSQQPQQQQPPYGGQFGAQAQPRGPYSRPAAPPAAAPGPRAVPLARGSLPYGARAKSSLVSSYESQAQKWKQGFTTAPAAATSAGGSRQSDVEAPLIAELCSSAGSSYPPRDVLQKLLRHLPSLDHQYVCELLDDKLEDRVWQVQGKALSVLDALFKSQEAEVYKNHYYYRVHVLEALCNSRKELLKARAEKIYNVIKSHTPPAPPSPEAMHQPDTQIVQTPPPPPPAPVPEVDLFGSLDLMAQDEPAEAPPSSAFGFLNSTIETSPTPPAPDATEEQAAPASAFSFLSSQVAPPTQSIEPSPPVTRVVAVTPVSALPVTHDIFSSLPPPTPVIGLATQVEEPPIEEPPVPEEPKVHDPIHDAFEGLGFGDDEVAEEASNDESSDNPLEGFKTGSGGTMGPAASTTNFVHTPVIKVDPNDPVREIILEIDVPAGPMGLVLDRSVPDMAIVQGFIRMPTGERGYLELHPVLCPGCAIVSINAINVEDKGLEEVGAILGSLINSYKVLRFKKLMRGGRTVNPANPDLVYTPPPPEKEEDVNPTDEEKEAANDGTSETDGDQFMERLTGYSNQLDDIEKQIEDILQRERSNLPVGDLKNQLAQLHGTVEKIQTQGIDSVILGANQPENADEIRQLRSSLVRRSDEITKRIQKIATNGTAPSPLVAPVVAQVVAPVSVGSPEVSAFSFVVGADGQEQTLPPIPPLKLPQPVVAPPSSGFSFMQSSASPASSPHGPGPNGSAFSFLSGGETSAAPVQPQSAVENSVFAGLSLRVGETETPSAFGFLSGAANSTATPVGVVDPPRVASPTAFSFMRGGAASPPPSPVAAGPGGSAFSFIS